MGFDYTCLGLNDMFWCFITSQYPWLSWYVNMLLEDCHAYKLCNYLPHHSLRMESQVWMNYCLYQKILSHVQNCVDDNSPMVRGFGYCCMYGVGYVLIITINVLLLIFSYIGNWTSYLFYSGLNYETPMKCCNALLFFVYVENLIFIELRCECFLWNCPNRLAGKDRLIQQG